MPSSSESRPKRRSLTPTYEMEDKSQTAKVPIKESFSLASLDYSIDSYPSKSGATTDNSVANGSIFSFATQQTKREGNDSSGEIPKDDELRALGWAKAFDPSSQNYYYYKLDRSR